MSCTTTPAANAEFDVGAAPFLSIEFVTLAGAPVNPTTVTLEIRKPNGTVVTYTAASSPAITNPTVGTFTLVLPAVDQAGDWWWRWEATGSHVDSKEGRFIVLGSAFVTVAPPAAGRWINPEALRDVKEMRDANLPAMVTYDLLVTAATDLMFAWTGRRYGQWSETIRPNRLTSSCGCADACGCWSADLRLAGPTIAASIIVVVDGVTLPTSAYDLFNGDTLVRVDRRLWPCCQSLSAPFGSPGTWSVSYTWGRAPKPILQLATMELAIAIAMRVSGKPSKLPAGTVGVSSRGLQIQVGSKHDRTGRRIGRQNVFTGIPLVDDAVFAENPNGLQRRATVASPDSVRRTRI